MFNVTALRIQDWAIIIGCTSLVLWIGEIRRIIIAIIVAYRSKKGEGINIS
jgi:hypothetical protein